MKAGIVLSQQPCWYVCNFHLMGPQAFGCRILRTDSTEECFCVPGGVLGAKLQPGTPPKPYMVCVV